MGDTVADNAIHMTRNYDKFSLVDANRVIVKTHVQKLIKSFEGTPDIARTRPILCNDRLEIIDGQHRFEAWKALNMPIYYITEKNLTMKDARRLNNSQKNWTIDDYAESFATEGNAQYQQYLEFREEYQLPHTVLRTYMEGYNRHRGAERFKEGDFKIMKDRKLMRDRIQQLCALIDLWPKLKETQVACHALQTAFKVDGFDFDAFYSKFKQYASDDSLSNYHGVRNDWLRKFEEIYNKRVPEDKQIRLFG